jgi:hypothetical protein
MNNRTPPFRYYTDPICIACLIIYPINRWYLKPHHIGGWFTHGYLNDVMCLPLFLPMILYVQRLIGLRTHDGYPRWWEILQHWVIFSVVFELILPTTPRLFTHTQDPWNAVAYLVGGVIAGIIWKWRARMPRENRERGSARAQQRLPRRSPSNMPP